MAITVVLADYTLDNGLAKLNTEATHVEICSAEPTTYTAAATTVNLGTRAGAFGALSNSADGRQTSISFSNGSVTASGTATHWAATDHTNSRLLARGPLPSSTAVTSGGTFSFSTTIDEPNTQASSIKTGLVAFWEFESTSWLDSHTNGLTLSAFGGLTGTNTTTTGKVANCLHQTGGTACLIRADEALLNFTGSFTLAFWFKVTGALTGVPLITCKFRSPTDEWRMLLSNTSGANWQLYFQITDGGGNEGPQWPTQDLTSFWQAWRFLVAQCDASGNILSLNIDNGTPVTVTKTKTISHGSNNFQVSDRDYAAAWDFDQYGFWTRVLNSTELTWLYNSGAGRAYSEF